MTKFPKNIHFHSQIRKLLASFFQYYLSVMLNQCQESSKVFYPKMDFDTTQDTFFGLPFCATNALRKINNAITRWKRSRTQRCLSYCQREKFIVDFFDGKAKNKSFHYGARCDFGGICCRSL